jgi:hypothetical protein
LARSIFRKGANFTAAMAFQFASTNLVIELGIIMAVLLGWQFTLAEFLGGPLMIEMPGSLAFVTVNRTQALVLGFFLLVWVSLLVTLVAAPDVFDQALSLATDHRVVELAVLAGLSSFIGLLVIGVVRRWRWMFWLILVAFLFGLLRVPAAVLQLTGILATNAPTWYVTFQALLGVLQFGIGLVMVADYRRSGVWGAY